jgi:hypothetical protein
LAGSIPMLRSLGPLTGRTSVRAAEQREDEVMLTLVFVVTVVALIVAHHFLIVRPREKR